MAVAWTAIPDSDVDPESPITTGLMQALRDNPEGIAGAASGAPQVVGGALADGAAVKIPGGTNLKVKVIEIGDWNMDSTITVFVPHGLTLSKIRSVWVAIRNDAATLLNISPGLAGGAGFDDVAGVSSIDSTRVILRRQTGGSEFDKTTYDSTSFNRGWITILYDEDG